MRCRVVQKALDSVPIEQQVLLIGELKGHAACIEICLGSGPLACP